MTSLDTATTVLTAQEPPGQSFDEEQMAAASFLARYNGRTLEAYRDDLRGVFQWAHDHDMKVMRATSSHIELFRVPMEQRGWPPPPSTLDGVRLLPIRAHRRDHARQPGPAERFDRDHAALAVLLGLNGLRVTEACETNVKDLGFELGHRTLKILGKGNKPATTPLVPRTARTIDLAVGERCEGQILRRRDGQRLDRRTAHRWVKAIGKRAGLGHVCPHMLRSAFIMAALDAGVPLREVQIAARHADPRTATIYDRRRQNFDRHAAYVVVAFVASG